MMDLSLLHTSALKTQKIQDFRPTILRKELTVYVVF